MSTKVEALSGGRPPWGAIADNLGRSLAILGVVASPVLLLMPLSLYKRAALALLLLAPCSSYLILERRMSYPQTTLLSRSKTKALTSRAVDLLFYGFLAYGIVSSVFRADLYVRPISFFVSTALAIGVLAVEIVLFPRKPAIFKVVSVALVLRILPQFIFPDLIGIDPYWHRFFTQLLISTGRVPEGYSYSQLPVMHLTTALVCMETAFDYKLSAIVSVSFLHILSLVFIFLIGRLFFGSTVALLAALLLGTADTYIELGLSIRPITLGLALVALLAYLVVRPKRSLAWVPLIFLSSVVLIWTHTIAALAMSTILLIFWASLLIYGRIYYERSRQPSVRSILCALFAVAMLSWWTFSSGFFLDTLARVIESGFMIEEWRESALSNTYLRGYELESTTNMIGSLLYYALSIVGCLCILSKKPPSRSHFAWAWSSYTFTALTFGALIASGLLASRWFPSSQMIAAIPTAVGLLTLAGSVKGRLRTTTALFLLVLTMSFLLITKPGANIDNPVYSKNTMIRYALTEAEVAAGHTISGIYASGILTDLYYAAWFGIFFPSLRSRLVSDMTPNLVSKGFEGTSGLIVLRQEIVERPFFVRGGVFRLDYDPRERMSGPRIERVYDSETVTCFLA